MGSALPSMAKPQGQEAASSFMTEPIMELSIEKLKQQNPWRVIADMESLEAYNENKEFVLKGDEKDIKGFNNKRRKKNGKPSEYEYNLHLPPMPFSGNLLTAKLVILTLNPGYVEYLNRDLVGKLAPEFQQEFLVAAKKHLRLEATSIYESEVERIVGENYWYRKLQPLAEAVYETNPDEQKKIFQDVAILQYIGYFSTKYHDSNLKLEGHKFIKKLLPYLLGKEDVMFLVMRARSKWEGLFKDAGIDYATLRNKRLIDDIRSPLSQAITPNNLLSKDGKLDGFRIIVDHLKTPKCAHNPNKNLNFTS